MSDDIINIEVDGKPVEARRGQMLIEVTDAVGAYVPRFCYHEKLSVAANCRMCLVDIEGAPKPIPACAQPVNDGRDNWAFFSFETFLLISESLAVVINEMIFTSIAGIVAVCVGTLVVATCWQVCSIS